MKGNVGSHYSMEAKIIQVTGGVNQSGAVCIFKPCGEGSVQRAPYQGSQVSKADSGKR